MRGLSVAERVARKTDSSPGPAACWPWLGGCGGKGGPMTSSGGRSLSARRIAWETARGEPVPDNRQVITTCGNPICLNPAHLELKPFMDHEARFWSFVNKVEGDGCWEWKSTFFASGYAAFGMNGKMFHASRVAWEFTHGPIVGHVAGDPEREVCVCHRCDNPRCVRPGHLFLGHDRDNIADMRAKGRHSHGPEHVEKARRTLAEREEEARARAADPTILPKPQKMAWLVGAGWTPIRKRGEPTWFEDPLGTAGQRMRVEEAFELQLRRERSGVAPEKRSKT